MECPICCETYDSLLGYRCDKCRQTECLQCYASWNKEECPFCRYSPIAANSKMSSTDDTIIYPQTYPPGPPTIIPYWEPSRTLQRQIRRERKRQEHELQQIRNAELSRIHNRNAELSHIHNRTKKTKQEKRQDMQFHLDDILL